jgi:hypothetical protein
LHALLVRLDGFVGTIGPYRFSSLPINLENVPVNLTPDGFHATVAGGDTNPNSRLRQTIAQAFFLAALFRVCDTTVEVCDPLATGHPVTRGVAIYRNGLTTEELLAHETGHALAGLAHAQRRDQFDPEYPTYKTNYKIPGQASATLPASSIGEFGYDPLKNKVYLPNTVDIMASANRATPGRDSDWISTFYYKLVLECMRTSCWEQSCGNAGSSVRCF